MKNYTREYIMTLKMSTAMKYKLIIMNDWWSKKSKEYHGGGSFDLDLYIRLIQIKAQDATK